MNVIEIPVVRWAAGLLSGGSIVAVAFFTADGTMRLVLYVMAAFALVSEPLVLGWIARRQ
ncbi:MAG: hypothetical protein ABEH88_13180 [Halobacteriales archaeon]